LSKNRVGYAGVDSQFQNIVLSAACIRNFVFSEQFCFDEKVIQETQHEAAKHYTAGCGDIGTYSHFVSVLLAAVKVLICGTVQVGSMDIFVAATRGMSQCLQCVLVREAAYPSGERTKWPTLPNIWCGGGEKLYSRLEHSLVIENEYG
jgi:hypothetical protein